MKDIQEILDEVYDKVGEYLPHVNNPHDLIIKTLAHMVVIERKANDVERRLLTEIIDERNKEFFK